MLTISQPNKQKLNLEISVNVGAFRRVKSLLGIDLTDLVSGDPPLIARLTLDAVLLCDVLYCVVKPQLDAAGITDEEFGESLGGDALKQGSELLMSGLEDFFQKSGRVEVAATIRAQVKATAISLNLGKAEIEAAMAPIVSRSGVGFSSLQEFADCVQTATRSASLSGCQTENVVMSGTAQP